MSGQQTEQALGKYSILGELGRGGFATVYRAQDTVLRRSIALKILHPLLLADPAFVRRFEQEAHATAQLDHPHIATIYELGQLEGRLYIAIQLLAGGTLGDRIRQRGPLPFAEAARVVSEIAEALDHAHTAGFVHRDVKPTNILFNARDEAVLTDFGMVKAVESSVIARSTMGNVIGTPAYIAPEVWEGKDDGPGTDVYALGCVLFEMLTGELLFKGNTPPAVMLAHFQRHQYPAHWTEGVPPQVEVVLERALARDLADRHVSAGALAADLRDLAARAADPLAEPYAALLAALAVEDWERTVQLAQEIAAQNPDYRDVPTLGRQAAEAQACAAQVGWAAQGREQALAAERAGQTDAARVAAYRWLEMAPEDAAAKALLARLDVIAERRQESAKNVLWSVGVIAVGWVAGWPISVELAERLGDTITASLIVWAIAWAVAGLIAGLALRWIKPSFTWRHVLMLAGGWSICLTIAILFGVQVYALGRTYANTLAVADAISPAGMAVGVTFAGLIAGVALRWIEPSITWRHVLLFAIILGIGWLTGEAGWGDQYGWHFVLAKLFIGDGFMELSNNGVSPISLAIGGSVGAVLSGGLMLWLLSRERRGQSA